MFKAFDNLGKVTIAKGNSLRYYIKLTLSLCSPISRCLPQLKILSLCKDNFEMFPIASWGLTSILEYSTVLLKYARLPLWRNINLEIFSF